MQSWAGLGFGVLAALSLWADCSPWPSSSPTPGFPVSRLESHQLCWRQCVHDRVSGAVTQTPGQSANDRREADTIGERTELYLLMVVLSVGVAMGARWVGGSAACCSTRKVGHCPGGPE